MRRWQSLLELLIHYALMTSPLHLGFPLGRSRRLPLVAWRFPFPWSQSAKDRVVLSSISWQSRLSLFILRHFFLLGMGQGLDMKWAGVVESFGPPIAPQNLAVRLLERGWGFWCSRAYFMVSRVLFPYERQGLFACPRHTPGISVYEVHCH